MDPYASPAARSRSDLRRRRQGVDWRRWTVVAMLIVFGIGFVLNWTALWLWSRGQPALSEFLMPRFGWSGVGDGMWPSIFLGIWLFQRHWLGLFLPAFMSFFVAGQQAWQLLNKGTVGVVANAFHDRLHESWLWAVAPFVLAGLACLLMGATAPWSPRERLHARRLKQRAAKRGSKRFQ